MNTEPEIETDIHAETMATRVALHPFLVGMEKKQLALLTDCAIGTHFRKGQLILKEGEQANRFYLIESGKVILESGKAYGQPVVIDTIGAGDLLGWSWMFSPYAWQFTARAAESANAIFFYGTILREHCERDHSLGYDLLKRMTAVMTRRMQAARQKMIELHTGDISLEPVVVQSPFMDQELDCGPANVNEKKYWTRISESHSPRSIGSTASKAQRAT